jgi:poly(A) polymerase
VFTSKSFTFASYLDVVRKVIPSELPAYLVGGAIRDLLLRKSIHDLDFVLPEKSLQIARKVADELDGAFYPLDLARQIGRVIVMKPEGDRFILDFSLFDGANLESDLRGRDFTINAMALSVWDPDKLIDPLAGAQDLKAKRLRACAQTAFVADPIRILRGIRMANAFNLSIIPETKSLMRSAVPRLPGVSPERLRNEIFKILETPRPATSIRGLDLLGALEVIFPELNQMKDVEQSLPHVFDVWNHTLDVVNKLELVLDTLSSEHDPENSGNLLTGLINLRLGRYRQQFDPHFRSSLVEARTIKALLLFAALYHDVGKPETQQVDEEGRIRFFRHEQVGEDVVAARARSLHLSNEEVSRLRKIVRHHLRPILLAQTDQPPSRRAIYRFFRQLGPVGVDICLLSLADVLSIYGVSPPQPAWEKHLDVVRMLLEAWWEYPLEKVIPPPLINGTDLIEQFKLKPGPLIGDILEAVQEAQATGQVEDRKQAFSLAEKLIRQKEEKNLRHASQETDAGDESID